jgi:hypothetical protein
LLTANEARRARLLGDWTVPRQRKAALAYAAKTAQILDLAARLGPAVLVLDYDDLTRAPAAAMGAVHEFLGLSRETRGLERIHSGSAASGLSEREQRRVRVACEPVYEQVRRLAVRIGGGPS